MRKSSVFLVSILLLIFSSCQPITETKEEITQINYIVPIWKGSLSFNPENPEIGWTYYNTSVKKSFIYDGSSWQILTQDGKDGMNIVWKGELGIAPSNPEINWAYYNTIDGNSYTYNGSSWDYLAKSGRDGASGILLWLGAYDFEPDNPSDGWAYYNTIEGVSYIYNNGSWQILSKDGIDGKSIIWKGVFPEAPKSPELYWAYYNTTNQISYIWNGASWDILSASSGGDTVVTVSIKWLGMFTYVPSNPLIGYAYYNSTVGASFIYDGSVWQQISRDGINNTDGIGYLITWKGSFVSAPANPKAGWAYYNTSAKKSFIYDGSSWQILAQDGKASNNSSSGNSFEENSFFIGETTETIDNKAYTVKSYASVYSPEPYFYTIYKYYYLNNKLRRTHVFYHGNGSDLDYKYNEFVEHICGSNSSFSQIHVYNENGKLEAYFQNSSLAKIRYEYDYDSNGNRISEKYYLNEALCSETRYDSERNKVSEKYYQDGILSYETNYYENGIKKEYLSYKTDVSPSYLYHKQTYYETGKEEYIVIYDSFGNENSKTYYTYYQNGNKKSELYYNSEGTLSSEKYSYSDGKKQLCVGYNSDETIDNFDYHYPSGYTQYYYTDSGYFYIYEDGKTTGTLTSSIYYSSKTSYTAEQAATKLADLKNNGDTI